MSKDLFHFNPMQFREQKSESINIYRTVTEDEPRDTIQSLHTNKSNEQNLK